ncbi:MAG: hypothetical protein V1800_04995 [Candidatus Latescibacterota bacterium]
MALLSEYEGPDSIGRFLERCCDVFAGEKDPNHFRQCMVQDNQGHPFFVNDNCWWVWTDLQCNFFGTFGWQPFMPDDLREVAFRTLDNALSRQSASGHPVRDAGRELPAGAIPSSVNPGSPANPIPWELFFANVFSFGPDVTVPTRDNPDTWHNDHDQWFDVELLGMLTLMDLLLFTRSPKRAQERWPVILLFEGHLRSRFGPNGCVLVGVQGSQLEFSQGQPRYMTATQFYARSFYTKAAQVARYLDQEDTAVDFENRAEALRKSTEAFRSKDGAYIGGRGEDWQTLYGTGRLDGSPSSYFEPYPNSVPAILGLFDKEEAQSLARRFLEIPEMTKNALVPFNWPERPLDELDDEGAFPPPGCHVNGGAFWMTTAALAALVVRASDAEGYAWMERLLPLHDARRTIDYYNEWGAHIETQWPEKQRDGMFSVTELGTYGWPLRAMLGIEPRHNGLYLDPVLPPGVDGLSFAAPVLFGSCRINIALKRNNAPSGEICRVTVQGEEIPVGEGTGVLIPEELLENQTVVSIEVGAK